MHKPDYIFITLVALILVFGLIMLSSASAPLAYEKFGDSYHYLKYQFLHALIGLVALYILSRFNYVRLKKFAFPLLIISIILLVIVFIPGFGATYGNARSWINIGGFSIQPSEIVKLTFLLYLATWLEKRGQKEVKNFFLGFMPFLVVLGLITMLVVMEPDIGTMTVIVAMSLATYFVAGGSIIHIFWVSSAGLALLGLLIRMAPYRTARFMTFLHPEFDPQGIGYHINQALLAIGSGGIFGLGLGHSRQKFQYLPEVAGDSIFAVIAEELGFILVAGLIILFLAFVWRGFRIAKESPDIFGKLLVCGIIFWIIAQAFINIGSMVGLLPMTGVPLPFISYGGTSLVVSMAAMGMVINVSKYTK